MPADSQANAISEMLTWLEQQLRLAREDQALANTQVQQLRQQVHTLAEDLNTANSIIREFEARLAGFRGIPEKVLGFDHDAEDLRQTFSRQRNELENALRLLRAEVEADRQERGESTRRIEAAQSLLTNLSTDVTQAQTQTAQANHTLQTVLERQREAEARIQQFALRIDRTMEVTRELEERIRANLLQEQEARLEVVFERLQVVGEMVRRNEELLNANRLEQTSRETVLHELSVWREEHTRIDSRINHLEELTDKFTGQIDKLQSEISLLDGRHAGLGERVVGIRRDIAEIVDHIREEFAKYNQMMEKQRRKQIQVLEQELREMKFHAFHPPEEP